MVGVRKVKTILTLGIYWYNQYVPNVRKLKTLILEHHLHFTGKLNQSYSIIQIPQRGKYADNVLTLLLGDVVT